MNVSQAALRAWCREHAEWQVELLRRCVEIESASDDPQGVARLAALLAGELEALGLAPRLLPVAGAGPWLLAAPEPAGPRPVMLLGHLDTVWPRGTLQTRPVRIDAERCYGPGSYDMKGGLVVVLAALRALKAHGGLPPVLVSFTPLEEQGGGAYLPRLTSQMRACRAVLDFEPAWPGGAVKTARKGSGNFVLRARGRAAHAGAEAERGANAVLDLARRVQEAAALADPALGLSVNVGTFHGGLRPNVVPDVAQAELDVRYSRLEDGRRLSAALRALRSDTPGVTLEIQGRLGYPPLERTPQVAWLFEQARAVAEEAGGALAEVATGGASEAAYAAQLGLPTLDGLGPDGDGAHAEHEHVWLPSLPERAALTAGLLRRLTAHG